MALELQQRVLRVLEQATARRVYDGPTPSWLQRPGRDQCGDRWGLVRRLYTRLTDGLELPDEMPLRENRAVDGLIGGRGRRYQLVEVDESQHFNIYRSMALKAYPTDVALGFPKAVWVGAGKERIPGTGGGWGAPKPPLFPMPGGRHRQRAFRDALADLLPGIHGFGPTVRIADFEVESWIWDRRASQRLASLIESRVETASPSVDA